MNRMLFLIAGLSVLGLTPVRAAGDDGSGKLNVSVGYDRQAGPGSNQFAVYIEDGEGAIVRTLYVTKFTAGGGYERRPACLPVWVKKSGVADWTQVQADAVSGATPQSGLPDYEWDLKDAAGNRVPDGDYIIVVEGTYWQDNQVMFRGNFTVGGDGMKEINIKPEFNSDEVKNRWMIWGVYADYFPFIITLHRKPGTPILRPAY